MSLIICVNNLEHAIYLVDIIETWDLLVDALIKTIKYLNSPHDGHVGPHISFCILSKTLRDSTATLLLEGLVISFPNEHAEHA